MCVCLVILFVGETYIYVTNYSSTTFVHRVAFSLRCHFLASLLDVLFLHLWPLLQLFCRQRGVPCGFHGCDLRRPPRLQGPLEAVPRD